MLFPPFFQFPVLICDISYSNHCICFFLSFYCKLNFWLSVIEFFKMAWDFFKISSFVLIFVRLTSYSTCKANSLDETFSSSFFFLTEAGPFSVKSWLRNNCKFWPRNCVRFFCSRWISQTIFFFNFPLNTECLSFQI